MMPSTFFAKRKFDSLLNTIVFYDRYGQEIGFVESWLMDWRNPFGYPGASFYLKAPPAAPAEGVWAIDPARGQAGWTTTTAPEGLTIEVESDPKSAFTSKQQNLGFLHSIFGADQSRLSAFMIGKQDPAPYGEPMSSQMTIMDCNGEAKFQASDGPNSADQEHNSGVVKSGMKGGVSKKDAHISGGTVDARYYQVLGNMENKLILADLGTPEVELVRLSMNEPCVPFPPFCQQMGIWNWFIHGSTWKGEIVQPGYNQTIGSGLVQIQMTDGAATDMRFLALYSAFQFSNTRWSPLMQIITNVLLIVCLFCCCRCCWRCCCVSRVAESVVKSGLEESEKLMKTVDANVDEAPPKPTGWMACCSRRGGRTVALDAPK
jgi:hypothetical protein